MKTLTESITFYEDAPEPGDVIACGDVHAQVPQFLQFLDWVKDTGARVVMLGDLCDRAKYPGDDLIVLNRVRQLIDDPESWGLESFISVIGNHEMLLINADDGYGWRDWVRNGGDWENFDKLKPHTEWIKRLPYYVVVGDTLFSHAGVIPGEDPQQYMKSHSLREQFVWNRGAFLRVGPEFEKWNPNLKLSVFGHTPRKDGQPWRVSNGICLDSGCYFSGTLTAYNATQNTFIQFTA